MIYEYRIYDVTPGCSRSAALAAFAQTAPHPLGAWTALAGPRMPHMAALFGWNTLAERDAAYPAGVTDPFWQSGQASSFECIETWLMKPSSAWRAARLEGPAGNVGGLHEVRVYRMQAGYYAQEATTVLGATELPQMQVLGATVLGVFDILFSPRMPAIVGFVAWPDFETQQHAMARLEVEPRLLNARKVFESYGRPLFTDIEQTLMEPIPNGFPQANFGQAA